MTIKKGKETLGSTDFHPNRFVASPDIVRRIQTSYLHYFPLLGKVADLGCGEGVFLDLLRASGRKGIGVDITPEFVRAIKRRGLKAVTADITTFLRKHRSSFDGIFASHIIEHLPAANGIFLIRSMFDALRSGGVAVLVTPSYEDILVSSERFWLDISHVRPYPLPLLHEVFLHYGFEIVKEGYDLETRLPTSLRHPRSMLRHIVGRMRFGRKFNTGDTFIVAKKP
ncbi:MAG: class I SAM-dependent methyltransferase [Ignavibacteriales bacterium]|nr:class I SAM-dependent methyltransferase [Ignavibacteriales bacterium]